MDVKPCSWEREPDGWRAAPNGRGQRKAGWKPVLAGSGIVALNCTSGGRREIALRNGKRIVCDLPRYTTACFDAQTGERLDRPLEK